MPNGTDLDLCPRNVTFGKDISNRGRKCRKHWSPNRIKIIEHEDFQCPCCRLSCNPNDTEYQPNMSAGSGFLGSFGQRFNAFGFGSRPHPQQSPDQFASQRVFVELWQDGRRPCYPQRAFCPTFSATCKGWSCTANEGDVANFTGD